MLQTSFWTTINFTFLSSNVLTIESSLKGHWENDALPELRTSVNLTLPISHHMLPLIGFGNSNHEMMLKIHRKPGIFSKRLRKILLISTYKMLFSLVFTAF